MVSLPENWSERTYVERGVRLPYRTPARPGNESMVGEIFIPERTLWELAEQDTHDSQFGMPLLLDYYEGFALEQAGLAVRETRGGFHRSATLLTFLDSMAAVADARISA